MHFVRMSAAAALAIAALAAHGQTPVISAVPPQNVVNLTASAVVEVVKDELTVVLSTTREGADATVVQAQLKQALDAALAEARKAARPGQLEVQTGGFSLYPRHSPKGGIAGWAGSAELVLQGRDVAAVSQLAGRIQTLTVARTAFSLSREAREQFEAEVTAQAIARFKQRAEQVARQFGFGGWSLREAQVHGSDMPVAPMPVMRAAGGVRPAGLEDALPVEAGKAQVSVTVSGSVQLSPR